MDVLSVGYQLHMDKNTKTDLFFQLQTPPFFFSYKIGDEGAKMLYKALKKNTTLIILLPFDDDDTQYE